MQQGREAAGAHLAVFSRTGFDPDLTASAKGRADVHLLSLEDLYQEP